MQILYSSCPLDLSHYLYYIVFWGAYSSSSDGDPKVVGREYCDPSVGVIQEYYDPSEGVIQEYCKKEKV